MSFKFFDITNRKYVSFKGDSLYLIMSPEFTKSNRYLIKYKDTERELPFHSYKYLGKEK
jgi:hypothetical protein